MFIKSCRFLFACLIAYCFPLIENLSESTLTVNTIGFTEGLHNASIVANLMDTLYLLINEPSVANPERASTNTKATLTDKKDAEENKEKKVNPDGWMEMGRRKGRRKTSPSLQLLLAEEQYVRFSSDTNYVFETGERS